MSMLDSFFNKGFKASKGKTLLKLAIPRIKLLRNRREIQIKQMRRDIAKLLETGLEATARIRVEHIIREENMMAAQEILELFCELIAVRLPIIESQRECPLDLKEAISSLCFAAPRCADLPELLQVQMLFASKYGKEFVSAATELMPDCGVNRQLIELLSVRAPSPEKKLKLLKEIAEEHKLDWDPAASETEFLKPHEDLLFVSGSKLTLPKEKHDEALTASPDQAYKELPDSDTDFDTLDFPEVPKVSVRPTADAASAPAIASHFVVGSQPEIEEDTEKHSGVTENPPWESHFEPKEVMQERNVPNNVEQSSVPVGGGEEKQFVPFIAPPSFSYPSSSARQSDISSALSKTKCEANVDLQDVLAAAQAAAETADCAAAAARSAASLAQIRISELTKKNSDLVSDNSCENPFHTEMPDELDSGAKVHFDKHNSFGGSGRCLNSSELYKEALNVNSDSSPPTDRLHYDEPTSHQPKRLPSMDDDSYFSHPNLFTSQNSNLRSGSQSFTDNAKSTQQQ